MKIPVPTLPPAVVAPLTEAIAVLFDRGRDAGIDHGGLLHFVAVGAALDKADDASEGIDGRYAAAILIGSAAVTAEMAGMSREDYLRIAGNAYDLSRRIDPLAPPQPVKVGTKVSVELDVHDALSVGMSLRTIARGMPTDTRTSEVYARVGDRMVEAYALESAAKGRPS